MHKIKTLEDIVKVVTSKNCGNFIEDFKGWLMIQIVLKENGLPEGVEQDHPFELHWEDDGKIGLSKVHIKQKEVEEEK